ncbi:6-hydroxymethylpterin diphosphokinase MptE-like protein [Aliarcobacter butzleri]|uniref:motility associated factor glycosyltransferase family protein n=1 Tax=Aliarcobacter butzleri TaxID=28197 RepID=UPI003AF9D6C6
MTQAQVELQNALTTTFLANLVFLSEYDSELYHRIDNLSKMIENGTYKERYNLEFVMENGDFDIFDTQTNTYLYDKNPKKINNNLVREIEFDGKKAIFNNEGYFKHRDNPTIDLNYKYKGEYSSLAQNFMKEYSFALNDYLDTYINKRYKTIKKFVFFGVFLGRHIPRIAQKIDASIYLVIESNLEIFRLSLFTVDYTILAKNNGVIFSIMEDLVDIEKKIVQFLNIGNLENYLIKFSSLGIGSKNMYELFLSHVYLRKASSYDFTRYLYTYVNKTTNVIKNEYKFLLFNKIKNDLDFFKDIPILYIAAGPSLDQNIEWIKENQDKFFIVTIGSVYSKLLNKGIKVDLVTTLDEQKWLKKKQFPDSLIEKIESNTVFLSSAVTTPKTLESLKNKNLFIFELYESFFLDNYCFDGFSIGEVTLDILLQLNAKNIYLVGLDLTVNQKTGDTHSSEAGSGISKIDLNKEKTTEQLNDKSIVSVKGNLLKEVKTIEFFYGSIKEVEKVLDKKDKDTKIYNLSQSGAYFEGSIPLNIKDLDVSTLKVFDKNIFNFNNMLNKFSQIGLNIEEKKKFVKNINFLQTSIKEQLKLIKESNFKCYGKFNDAILVLIQDIKNNDILTLYKILFNYYEIVIPYLNYHFNDMRINQEYKKVEKVKNIFIEQVDCLINDYVLSIERVLK